MKHLTVRILKEDISLANQKTIQKALGIIDKKDLVPALEKIAKAALLEYCKMILENGTPTKVETVREERLFFLIQHYFKNSLPKEKEIEAIFHLGNKSTALLQNTISHYRTRLPILNASLLEYLTKARVNATTEYYEFECTSNSIIQQMNSIIKDSWPSHEVISKVPKTGNIHQCPKDTHDKLKAYLQNV